MADSREKLEADLRKCVRNVLDDGAYETREGQPIDENLVDAWMPVFIERLDRQAAITRAEVFEDGEFDCMTCGAKRELQERVDSLTAERELYRDNMIAQTKRVAELTAERDQLQADLDACRMREKAAEDYDFREAAERWEQAFEDKCCEVVRLTAERDELKERVARFDSISNIDGVANLLVQFEDLTAERDEWKTKFLHKEIADEFHTQLCREEAGRRTRDNVTSPKHYISSGSDGLECIDAIKASMSSLEFAGYLRGNVMKYIWRFRKKGGVEDLEKARWYLDKLIEEEKNYYEA